MKNNLECFGNIILIIILFLVFTTNNVEVNKISNKMVNGNLNTILILVIITLILTENVKIGFYLTIIYLVLLMKKNHNIENFDSDLGYSPLDCNTYGESKKKTGNSFYPLHMIN